MVYILLIVFAFLLLVSLFIISLLCIITIFLVFCCNVDGWNKYWIDFDIEPEQWRDLVWKRLWEYHKPLDTYGDLSIGPVSVRKVQSDVVISHSWFVNDLLLRDIECMLTFIWSETAVSIQITLKPSEVYWYFLTGLVFGKVFERLKIICQCPLMSLLYWHVKVNLWYVYTRIKVF